MTAYELELMAKDFERMAKRDPLMSELWLERAKEAREQSDAQHIEEQKRYEGKRYNTFWDTWEDNE